MQQVPNGFPNTKQCAYCHKKLTILNFMRLNSRGSGEVVEWKTCSGCVSRRQSKALKVIDQEYNLAYNKIDPTTNE